MPEYHIRYTCSGDLQNQIVDFIMRNAQQYIISREFANREHIQCYVFTNVVKKTWVNKFNLKFKDLDRRDKYVMDDKGKTKLYVCKGSDKDTMPDIISKLGFDDDDITSYHLEYWKNHKIENNPILLPETFDVKPEKVKAPKPPTFMRQCRDELEDEYPEKEWTVKDKVIVFKKIMYKLGQGCRNLDHIIISRMTYGVLNSLVKDKKEWLEYWFRKSFGEDINPYDKDEINDYD